MKFDFKQLKGLSHFPIWKAIFGLIVAGIVFAFGYLGYFLYQNVYQTVTSSDEIILLRQEVAPDTINTTQVNEVLSRLEQKINAASSQDAQAIRNPFSSTGSRQAPNLID